LDHREEKKMQSVQRLNDLLIEAIDETLASLGEPTRNQVYILLEADYMIPKRKIPEQIAEFSSFLYRMFGFHAKIIEIKCMRSFCSKIKKDPHFKNITVFFEGNDLTFAVYAEKFREAI
jgi:hypothetical protein